MAKIVSDKITITLSKLVKDDTDNGLSLWDDATINQITKVAEKLHDGTGIIVEVEQENDDNTKSPGSE